MSIQCPKTVCTKTISSLNNVSLLYFGCRLGQDCEIRKAKQLTNIIVTVPKPAPDAPNTVAYVQINKPVLVKLDCSLQRHHFQMLEESQAKPMNSVLHRDVSQHDLQNDLREVGLQFYQALNASTNSPFSPPQGHCWGDYTCSSGRTYRVDNVSPVGRLPNHCYPISGPKIWGNLNKGDFDFVRLVSRIVLAGGLHATLGEIRDDCERRKVIEDRQKLESIYKSACQKAKRQSAAVDQYLESAHDEKIFPLLYDVFTTSASAIRRLRELVAALGNVNNKTLLDRQTFFNTLRVCTGDPETVDRIVDFYGIQL